MGKVRAVARGRVFEDVSWNGLVSRVVAAYRLNTSPGQRTQAARDLSDGNTAYIEGVRIEVTR